MTNGEPIAPLAFLDTNALHFMRLFLSFARSNDLAPCGSSHDDPVERFKAIVGRRGQTLENFKKGQLMYEGLKARIDGGARVEYSPITRIELVCGLLRGSAILNAAAEGIPHRMWTRIDEYEILHRLDVEAYNRVRNDTDGIPELFRLGGIEIKEINPETMRDAWAMTRELLQFVFMDSGDSIVYASSLLVEADELMTADDYLSSIANRIENPGGLPGEEEAYFYNVQTRLKDAVARAIGIEPAAVHLPKAVKH